MNRLIAVSLLVAGVAVLASAAVTPEIDPGSGANALALIAGVLVVMRGRRKK
jgi:hypothetical protein